MAIFYTFNDGVNEYTINLDNITYIEQHSKETTKVHLVCGNFLVVEQPLDIVKHLIETDVK